MKRLSRFLVLDAVAAVALSLFWGARADAQNRVNGPDQAIVTRLHSINQDEVTMAQMGAARASNAQVQSFATQMVSDHRAADDKLLSYASDRNMNLDTIARSPSAQAHGLENAPFVASGVDAFDYNFIAQMVANHQAAIDVADQGSRMARDPELRALIARMMPTLRHHLAMAEDLSRRIPAPAPKVVTPPGEPKGVSRSNTGADENPGMGHPLVPVPYPVSPVPPPSTPPVVR